MCGKLQDYVLFNVMYHLLSFTAQIQSHLPPQAASLSSFHYMTALFGASGGCIIKRNASPVQSKKCSRLHCMSTHPTQLSSCVVIAAAFSHLVVDQSWLYEKWDSSFTVQFESLCELPRALVPSLKYTVHCTLCCCRET